MVVSYCFSEINKKLKFFYSFLFVYSYKNITFAKKIIIYVQNKRGC
nr:MAG TPA: hypothetical protein [Caudoviricetes sp.]